jgi:signal transduction histidine kinase
MPAQIPLPSERLEQLVGIGALLTTEHSLGGVLDRVVEVAAHLIGAKFAAIGVLGPDGKLLESFTTFGITPEERERMGPPPRGHGILGLVISEGRVIRLPDLTKHPNSFGFPPHHPPMHSFLGVPIAGRRGTFGNLYLTEKIGQSEFTDDDVRIAQLLATQTGAAVENARLHEESARLLGEVQQLQRSRERFFATVNHELRNALAATFGWAEILVRRKDPSTVPRAAFEVFESAEQAVRLINDLLDLSRLDEDRLRPVFREVDVASVVRRAIGRVTPVAASKGVVMHLHADRDLPTASTDAARVEQILVNLLGNAVRHTADGSNVEVSLRAEGDRLVIQVDDEGPGVAEADLEVIFDVYVTKAGEEARGVGLGLPLSRRLARLLGGELHAVSRPGAGGRFLLAVPLAEAHAPEGS